MGVLLTRDEVVGCLNTALELLDKQCEDLNRFNESEQDQLCEMYNTVLDCIAFIRREFAWNPRDVIDGLLYDYDDLRDALGYCLILCFVQPVNYLASYQISMIPNSMSFDVNMIESCESSYSRIKALLLFQKHLRSTSPEMNWQVLYL